MTAIVFMIALLGCGEGESSCQPIAVLETRYESRAACIAETEAVLARNISDEFPIIVAQCREEGQERIIRTREVRLPSSTTDLHQVMSHRWQCSLPSASC